MSALHSACFLFYLRFILYAMYSQSNYFSKIIFMNTDIRDSEHCVCMQVILLKQMLIHGSVCICLAPDAQKAVHTIFIVHSFFMF
jgi:hypothetical protein